MEILETQDPEKRRLMDEAKKSKDNLTKEVRMISERTEKIITNAVIIGGALALTYVIVRQFSGGKSKKKKAKAIKIVAQAPNVTESAPEEDEESVGNSLLTQIGTKIANEATVFLLNLAKEKLTEYLQGKELTKSNHEDH